MSMSIAESTRKRYTVCLQRFIEFCAPINLQVFPLHEYNMILFASHIGTTSSYSNIKVHLAAIKYFAEIHGYTNHHQPLHTFKRLYLVLRGIKRSHGKRFAKQKRAPVTPNLLRMIKFKLFNSSKHYEDKCMIWSAMLVAFFGFLRVSEFTSTHVKSFNHHTTLCFEDVHLIKDSNNKVIRISIDIKASKTDPFRLGTTIRLSANGSQLCPVAALVQFLHMHPYKKGPLFTSHDGKYLTRKTVSQELSTMVNTTVGNFSSHSFRIGAATTAAAAGYPRWLIQTLGRWTSDCYQQYIRVPDTSIDAVSRSLILNPTNNVVFDPANVCI